MNAGSNADAGAGAGDKRCAGAGQTNAGAGGYLHTIYPENLKPVYVRIPVSFGLFRELYIKSLQFKLQMKLTG